MTSGIAERVQRVQLLRQGAPSGHARAEAVLRAGLSDIAAIRSWATAAEAHLVRELDAVSSFPEAVIADATRTTTNAATKTRERADTLDAAPAFDEALGQGTIVSEHLDELSRAARRLDNEAQRAELFDRADDLLSDAERSTIGQFRRTLAHAVRAIQRDDGMARLARQQRATTMSTWVDDDGMWSLRAKFDPLTGLKLGKAIDRMLATVFAEAVPEHCPTDPVTKQQFLRALALARLIEGESAGAGSNAGVGVPEFVAVIDADQPNGNGEATVDWGINVEIPLHVVADLLDADLATVVGVVVRNGVVIHAPGQLDLGRNARHANRAQRRALRALYSTCSIPGCGVHFDQCKMHHIEWWSNGGLTNLSNLLPVCVIHHHKIHDDGWIVSIDDHRRLEVDLPDGTIMTTGPPARHAG